MAQLSILVPFSATCHKHGVTFTDEKALKAHVLEHHNRHAVRETVNQYGRPSTTTRLATLNRDPRQYIGGQVAPLGDSIKVNPRPTRTIKAGDGTFEPKPGDPGSVLTWEQDGVERSGQVQFNGGAPKTVWVVPFERGEGEHAVLLNNHGHVLDTWGREFSATPETPATELAPREPVMTEVRNLSAGDWQDPNGAYTIAAIEPTDNGAYLVTFQTTSSGFSTTKLCDAYRRIAIWPSEVPEVPEATEATEATEVPATETFELVWDRAHGVATIYAVDGLIVWNATSKLPSMSDAIAAARREGYAYDGNVSHTTSDGPAVWVTRETEAEPTEQPGDDVETSDPNALVFHYYRDPDLGGMATVRYADNSYGSLVWTASRLESLGAAWQAAQAAGYSGPSPQLDPDDRGQWVAPVTYSEPTPEDLHARAVETWERDRAAWVSEQRRDNLTPRAELNEQYEHEHPRPSTPEPDPSAGRSLCPECDSPSVIDGACTNPACFSGLSAYRTALASWQRDRDAYVASHVGRDMPGFILRELYERDHPEPSIGGSWQPAEPAADSLEAASATPDPWGEPYGTNPAYVTPDGPVWLRRKGQRTRFYDATGERVGPEQTNVAPAVCYAFAQGWQHAEHSAVRDGLPRDMTGLVTALDELATS